MNVNCLSVDAPFSVFEKYGFQSGKTVNKFENTKVNRLAKVTDLRNTEQVVRFQNILKAMGVFDALKEAGVQEGDTVKIGHLEFDYLY